MDILFFSLFSFVVTITFGYYFLEFLKKKKIIQPILEDVKLHQNKAGTPTMGGLTFIVSIIITSFLAAVFKGFVLNELFILFIFLVIGFGLIGFQDDFLKITKRDNKSGLSPKQKLILQFLIGIVVSFLLYLMNWDSSFSLAGFTVDFGFLYFLIIPIMIVGFSNATNLTDGLDGLLTTLCILVFWTFAFLANASGLADLALINVIIASSLGGFLYYNKFPARMFMGDTGSLVLGAIFAYACIMLKVELLSIIIGFVFIAEVLSVISQVSYFRYTKVKFGVGKRIFLMAPLHHHFEKKGYSEKKIVFYAMIIQLILILLFLFSLI